MDKKPTDSEIVKALECCIIDHLCNNCPLNNRRADCLKIEQYALDLINRLQKELDIMSEEHLDILERLETAKAEAYKEFAERVKKGKQYSIERHENIVPVAVIDWIKKELVGDEK